MILVRQATAEDAQGMCDVINPLIVAGGTTAHRSLFDPPRMQKHYIAPTYFVSCAVAVDCGSIVGFQALEWADPNWPGADSLPSDWCVVASFVARETQGKGIGRLLWSETLARAKDQNVKAIDATIRRENALGLAFYSALGFQDHRESAETISKAYSLSESHRD